MSNCGGCGIECGQGETCSNGQCVCGSTGGRCNYPQVCDGTQCVACTGPTTDLLCSKQNVFDFNGYCTTGKQCAECPAGFADCRATDKSGAADSGTADDCETPITTPSDCGACGAICGQHGAQACCSGTCKCQHASRGGGGDSEKRTNHNRINNKANAESSETTPLPLSANAP